MRLPRYHGSGANQWRWSGEDVRRTRVASRQPACLAHLATCVRSGERRGWVVCRQRPCAHVKELFWSKPLPKAVGLFASANPRLGDGFLLPAHSNSPSTSTPSHHTHCVHVVTTEEETNATLRRGNIVGHQLEAARQGFTSIATNMNRLMLACTPQPVP